MGQFNGHFKDKVAIVTGSGGGIGQAYAEALAREGSAVVVADINVEGAQKVADGIRGEGGTALALPVDVSDPVSAKAMADATDYTNSIARKENEDALAQIKASGKTTLHYLTDDQRKAWQVAMQPTYKWAKNRVGQEVLDLVAKELDVKMN